MSGSLVDFIQGALQATDQIRSAIAISHLAASTNQIQKQNLRSRVVADGRCLQSCSSSNSVSFHFPPISHAMLCHVLLVSSRLLPSYCRPLSFFFFVLFFDHYPNTLYPPPPSLFVFVFSNPCPFRSDYRSSLSSWATKIAYVVVLIFTVSAMCRGEEHVSRTAHPVGPPDCHVNTHNSHHQLPTMTSLVGTDRTCSPQYLRC